MTETLTGQFALVGRSGAIVAMSTGLMASAAVPAQALADTSSRATVASVDTSASTALITTSMSTGRSAVLIGSQALAQGTAISAPSTAKVTFETKAFKAAPAPVRKVVKTTAVSAPTQASVTVVKPAAAPTGTASGSSVLAIAARYVGTPYVYGGTTPRGFDCSGFVGYVYRQLGVSLPRTANDQMNATRQIPRSQAQPGDLVFFVSGGRAYHDGIYAGGNMMYDSPRSGKSIQKREIWSADVVFARVTG
ncbi:MAG TPA: NlpC/P60 family protein [Kineosporiaceae bacterium]|nr:NlpC/P60 family protein [Kineosporiaceae bacterium]